MADSTPAWWPPVRTAVGLKRRFTALLLDLATVRYDGDTLHLTFSRPGAAEKFSEPASNCTAILRTALDEHGIDAQIAVHATDNINA